MRGLGKVVMKLDSKVFLIISLNDLKACFIFPLCAETV